MATVTPTLDFSENTEELVALVRDAAELIRTRGEEAFEDLRTAGSRWRQDETYIFVLDLQGNMLVHPDPTMENRNEMDLRDINGKPVIRGLIGAANALPDKPEGWYHYQWTVPGGILPRWKSSYVRRVTAPSGASYVVGSGVYSDRMEKSFVIDMVADAIAEIEKHGREAFHLFHDPTGPFIAKDAYIFVLDVNGDDLVNPGFPNLEGRNLMDLRDTLGNQPIREMFKVVETQGSGWVDYMWPKPGESVSTQKSAYVSKAKLEDGWVLVGCGVYLADAPRVAPVRRKMTAPELMTLVREAATLLKNEGENAYAEFRTKDSKWYHDDTYFFVWSMDGVRSFHATDPALEGKDAGTMVDVLGRPYGRMILDVAGSPAKEGWVHYVYPEPGDIFPTWKSVFVRRVTFPSGKDYVVGCGIYNMEMDKAFIEDEVDHAAALLESEGKNAFRQLRDRTGPFYFMDTYVFVDSPDGTELMNAAFPSLEGKNLRDLRDVQGKAVVQEEIDAAMKNGSAWLDLYWYKPGQNKPARKQTFVRRVQSGQDTYIVGSGVYMD